MLRVLCLDKVGTLEIDKKEWYEKLKQREKLQKHFVL